MPRAGRFVVYIVRCATGAYYTGYTKNLDARLRLHNAGNGARFLRGKGPVELVYAKAYRYYLHAVREERRLKRRSRADKDALVRAYAQRLRASP